MNESHDLNAQDAPFTERRHVDGGAGMREVDELVNRARADVESMDPRIRWAILAILAVVALLGLWGGQESMTDEQIQRQLHHYQNADQANRESTAR
jgi:hypothetical protein